MMLPTPSTTHVPYDTIYEPAEDSFLLLDTLSSASETAWLKQRFHCKSPAPLLVEVGTGSGVVIAFAVAHAQVIFGRNDVLALGVDVNEYACKATMETVAKASLEIVSPQGGASYVGSICGDLSTALVSQSVDILIFNPPYVPTDDLPTLPEAGKPVDLDYATSSHLLSLSYAGGKDGMETTERLLEDIPQIMSKRGVAYVLLCASNKPDQIKARIKRWGSSWAAETVSRSGKKAGWEKLEILRIWQHDEP